MKEEQKSWYESWFNTPYYHILYKERDLIEAQQFIKKLALWLNIKSGSSILDVACGKGRHSIFLNQLGYEVTGIDLASESIEFARKSENDTLHFYCHDMRKDYYLNYFDVVVNLFTSIGYFEDNRDNLASIKAMARNLRPGGVLVLDFFNETWIKNTLVKQIHKQVDGIEFDIKKTIENGKIVKTIQFSDKGQIFHFKEEVSLLSYDDFSIMFEQAGISIEHHFGNYNLDPFHREVSERLILIGRKQKEI